MSFVTEDLKRTTDFTSHIAALGSVFVGYAAISGYAYVLGYMTYLGVASLAAEFTLYFFLQKGFVFAVAYMVFAWIAFASLRAAGFGDKDSVVCKNITAARIDLYNWSHGAALIIILSGVLFVKWYYGAMVAHSLAKLLLSATATVIFIFLVLVVLHFLVLTPCSNSSRVKWFWGLVFLLIVVFDMARCINWFDSQLARQICWLGITLLFYVYAGGQTAFWILGCPGHYYVGLYYKYPRWVNYRDLGYSGDHYHMNTFLLSPDNLCCRQSKLGSCIWILPWVLPLASGATIVIGMFFVPYFAGAASGYFEFPVLKDRWSGVFSSTPSFFQTKIEDQVVRSDRQKSEQTVSNASETTGRLASIGGTPTHYLVLSNPQSSTTSIVLVPRTGMAKFDVPTN